jgi:beta-galactosidase
MSDAYDPNKGALPRNVSWYRKHFSVDASAQGRLVSLEFDGVYRASTYWL